MCVIIAKKKDDRLPTIDELKNCYTRNPDGAGFMYTRDGVVVIDKGYMTMESFINRYMHLLNRYNDFKNKALVIHCRIGTAGTNSKQNTHPYPVTSSIKKLHKTYSTCKLGIAHNGIIHDYNPSKDCTLDVNDTQLFISTFLSSLYNNFSKFYHNQHILDAIEYISGSKFAILNGEDELVTIGDFIEKDGLLFSNTSYLPTYTYYNDWRDWYQDYEEYLTSASDKSESVNLKNLIDIPSSYYIEYDDEIYKSRDGYYCIDIDSEVLYKYNENEDRYEYITYDYQLYDANFEPVTSMSEWL